MAADLLDEGVILIPFEENDEITIAEENIEGPMVRSEIDIPEGPLFRFQAYRKAWEECLERIKLILLKLQRPMVEEAVRCIYESAIQPEDDFLLPVQEIMTVVISCPDRAFAHSSLGLIRALLTMSEPEDNLPYTMVSQIHDTDCTSLASMIKALISGLKAHPIHQKLNLKSSSDIQVLLLWVEEVKAQLESEVSLIVVLPDISLIAPALIADFFDFCHCHISKLSLTILTTASDTGYFNRILPRSTLTKLRMENFNLSYNRQVIEHIIEETFFSPEYKPLLMIGPSSLEMIITDYSRSNTTLDNFLSNIQILFFQHFYNPLALLCVSSFDNTLSTMLQRREDSPKWMAFMKLIRLKLLSKDISSSDWSDLLPSEALEKAIEGRKAFHTRILNMKVALRIWDIIQNFCRALGLKLKNASSLLETSIDALRNQMGNTIADAVASSFKLLDKVQTTALLEELLHFVNKLPSTVRSVISDIRQQIITATEQSGKWETCSEFLARYFRATLISFDDIPLLDIWQTNDDVLPNSPFNPNVHVSIVTALLEPRGYLDWGISTRRTTTTDMHLLPDVSLAFQRYVDSGRMINVYDWYQTFIMPFERHDQDPNQDEDDEDPMDVDDTPTKTHKRRSSSRLTQGINSSRSRLAKTQTSVVDKRELQARFMRTVHELEFVGFLKRTGRRTEHVVKTVFDVMD